MRFDIDDPVALRPAAVYPRQFDDRRGALATRGLRLHLSATNFCRTGKVLVNLAHNVVRPPR